MVASPEISRVINEFESCFRISSNSCDYKHHDQNPSIQKALANDVTNDVLLMHFLEDSSEVITLDTK